MNFRNDGNFTWAEWAIHSNWLIGRILCKMYNNDKLFYFIELFYTHLPIALVGQVLQ